MSDNYKRLIEQKQIEKFEKDE